MVTDTAGGCSTTGEPHPGLYAAGLGVDGMGTRTGASSSPGHGVRVLAGEAMRNAGIDVVH
jgi:hypothetical protein